MSNWKGVARCELCGEPMPPDEQMFKYHGYSGDCPKPPLPRPRTVTEERWGIFDPFSCSHSPVLYTTEQGARAEAEPGNEVVRVTLTYTVPEGM